MACLLLVLSCSRIYAKCLLQVCCAEGTQQHRKTDYATPCHGMRPTHNCVFQEMKTLKDCLKKDVDCWAGLKKPRTDLDFDWAVDAFTATLTQPLLILDVSQSQSDPGSIVLFVKMVFDKF